MSEKVIEFSLTLSNSKETHYFSWAAKHLLQPALLENSPVVM